MKMKKCNEKKKRGERWKMEEEDSILDKSRHVSFL